MKKTRPVGLAWDAKKSAKFRRLLLAWYARNRRELPWRSDPTPYRVWISEIMLQQTRVSTAIPYYVKFLERFPDLESLAGATEQEVLARWAGLGYYSRARNLHRAARVIVAQFRGRFPDRLEEVRQLPGIGRYTAGAICSIAYNQPEPVVDGNVRRVLARLVGWKSPPSDSLVWTAAADLMPREKAADFNQALMEIGALICSPSDPGCNDCPVYELCSSRGAGALAGMAKKPADQVELVILVLTRGQRIWVCRASPVDFIPGSWFLPSRILQKPLSPEETAGRMLGGRQNGFALVGRVRHAITSRRLLAHVFLAQGISRVSGGRWVDSGRVSEYLTSSLFLKACRRAAEFSAARRC
jgi:A/G-specific adenine glycosylase